MKKATGIVAALFLFLALSSCTGQTVSPPPEKGSSTPIPVATATTPAPAALTTEPATPAALVVGNLVGNLAPDFKLLNLEGKSVSLSDFKGKPVWINFWATW